MVLKIRELLLTFIKMIIEKLFGAKKSPQPITLLSTLPIREEIDLTATPYQDLVYLFEHLMLDILKNVLRGQNTDVQHHLQTDHYINIMSDLKLVEMPHRELTKKTVANGQLSNWRSETILETERILGIHIHQLNIPDDIWDMLGMMAWQTPRFRKGAIEYIEQVLSGKIFYHTGEMPLPELHKNTYWILLAGFPFKDLSKDEQITINYLQEKSDAIINNSKNWAGHWDMWLIMKAKKRWGKQAKWASTLQQYIRTFPINDITPNNLSDRHLFVRTNWFDETPDYFKEWLESTTIQFL